MDTVEKVKILGIKPRFPTNTASRLVPLLNELLLLLYDAPRNGLSLKYLTTAALRKTTENRSRDSLLPGRYLNRRLIITKRRRNTQPPQSVRQDSEDALFSGSLRVIS